jgi:hypothetical protein
VGARVLRNPWLRAEPGSRGKEGTGASEHAEGEAAVRENTRTEAGVGSRPAGPCAIT